MANEVNMKAVITADDRASAVIKNVGDNTSAAADKMKNALAVAGAAAITLFGKQSVQAFVESQSAVAQLDAVLKSTAGSAGITRQAALNLSKEIENTTSLSDEAALAVENMGLTFTNIHADIFPQFIKASIDTATALNHGLKPSTEQLTDVTKMLGKAMQDPDGSIMALHRYGINTDELKPKVEAASTLIEKQRLIVAELGTEFGGSASAQAKTFGGQMDQLKEKFNDLQEQVGQTIVTAIKPFVLALSEHPLLLKAVTDGLLALAAAFVAVKIAAAINVVMDGAKVAIMGVGTAAQFTQGAMASTSAFLGGAAAAAGFFAIAGVAVAAAGMIISAANSAKAAWDNAAAAAVNAGNSDLAVIRQLQNTIKNGTPDQQSRARTVLNRYQTTGHFAGGVENFEGGLAYVHQGEMLVNLPKGTDVIPNNRVNDVGKSSPTINIHINAGAFMGSQIEARKYAQMIISSIKDIASQKNMSVEKVLGIRA